MTTYYDNTAEDLDLGIDLGNVDETNQFDPIPAAEYRMQAVEISLEQSQAGNNMVKGQFMVIGGQYDNRRIFENYNIQNANPKTVEIAQRQIKQWCMACGFSGNERLTMGLLKSLEGKEFVGQVYIQKDKSGVYGDQNRIRSYKPVGGASAPAPQTQPQQAASAPQQRPTAQQKPASTNKMPWEK